jgi:cytochrome c biogenesis protein CcmG/thiol:disulfide interchange protein DsbE
VSDDLLVEDGPVEEPGDGPDDGSETVDAPPRRRSILLVSLGVAVVIAAFVAVLATRAPSTDRQASSALIGKAAPQVSGKTLAGGNFNMDNQLGRWVVVNFFATWCVPCVEEHPQLDNFQKEHAAKGDAALVSVLYDDEPGKARTFFKEHGGQWPVVLDDGSIATYYGVTGVPESYLISPDGRVWKRLTGGVTTEGLDRLIAEADALNSQLSTGSGQ